MTAAPPALPLSETETALVTFCKGFYRNKPGFFKQYERRLGEIWNTSRRKRGLKSEAYTHTEQLYEDLFCEGPLFADRQNFTDEYSKYRRSRKPRKDNVLET